MEILFTKSDLIGSKWIRRITGEPVSHCAIRYRNLVMHASYWGVELVRYDDFIKKNEIVYKIEMPVSRRRFLYIYQKYRNAGYDYGAFFFLALRYLAVSLHLPAPKVNLWNSSGLYICTEFVVSAILGKQDSLITPYQLYLKLSNYMGVR